MLEGTFTVDGLYEEVQTTRFVRGELAEQVRTTMSSVSMTANFSSHISLSGDSIALPSRVHSDNSCGLLSCRQPTRTTLF